MRGREAPDRVRWIWLTLPPVLLAVLAVVGWSISAGHGKPVAIVLIALAFLALASSSRGATIGVLLLGAMNGLPFINTSHAVSGNFTLQDVMVVVLLATALAWLLLDDDFGCRSRAARLLSIAGFLLLVWWIGRFAWTVGENDLGLRQAATFVRDFFYFAVLLIVLPRVRLSERDIGALLGVCLIGLCIFSGAQIATAFGLNAPGAVLHVDHTLQQSGLTRVYADMTDLVVAGLAACIAASIAARTSLIRTIARPVTILLTVSIIVQLTRARWVGLIVGLVLVSLYFALSSDAYIGRAVRRYLGPLTAALATGVTALLLFAPGVTSGGTVINRVGSIFGDVETGSGTVAVREHVTGAMTAYLGEKWPFGLGFVPPSAHYYFGLPAGSILDSDLGVLNALMTLGAIGAALIYLPLVMMLFCCLRAPASFGRGRYDWLRFGGTVWIVATLVSSVTLVTLFSTSGLVMSAVFLTLLSQPSVLREEAVIAAAVPHRQSVAMLPS